jgi:MFS family permease
MPASAQKHSDWEPLAHPVFRALWLATVISYVGSGMQDAVGPAFMTRLTGSAFIVALVQSAAALPICLLSLPAGALADVLDRRRLLIAMQLWMLVAAALLGIFTLTHIVAPGSAAAPWILLSLTFMLGMGNAMSGPAFLRVLPELVPASQMPSAMALNSIALNVARAAGPALGALAVIAAGPGSAFLINAISFAAVVWVLWRWRPAPQIQHGLPEGFWYAMGAGFRYARYAPRLQAVLARVALFICCASAMWSLTAVLARRELGLAEVGYCMLMASLGVGAIVGIVCMPRVQRKISTDQMVALATAIFALGVFALALCPFAVLSCVIMFVIGANWVVILTNFNVATQRAVPAWVKGRAMSMYLLTLWGSWAVGSAFWGAIARFTSAHVAMCFASLGLFMGLIALAWLRLVPSDSIDFNLAFDPSASAPLAGNGLVHIEIPYRIPESSTPEFIALMRALRRQRLRNGASHWQLISGKTFGSFTERFTFVSASQFARQRSRITRSEFQLEQRALDLHTPGEGDAPLDGHWTLSAIHLQSSPANSPDPGQRMQLWMDHVSRRILSEFAVFLRRVNAENDRPRSPFNKPHARQ